MLLADLYTSGHARVVDGPLEWRDAIRESVAPLVDDGSVDACYADELIASVERYGPYIVLVPGLAMPHAMEGARGAHRTTMSFMRVRVPVRFDDTHEASVFFTLSDVDEASHLANMRQLYGVISSPDVLGMLMEVEAPEDLLRIDAIVREGATGR